MYCLSLIATPVNLEALAAIRLNDAVLLLQNERYSSAYYLSGYAIELSLKACIAKSFQPNAIPDKTFVNKIYEHNLVSLFSLAGLMIEFEDARKANAQLEAAWGIVSKWTEVSRYQLWDGFIASNMVEAVINPQHRVYQWVKNHW